ncbi:ABC transporter ATP-binding protein [Halobacillus sp. B29]|uniref:ABC transporter ATP-binding protein n=1 Tax=Halobacillus sp. B29 TaxID=3457432 RepID=UPI003FCCA68B
MLQPIAQVINVKKSIGKTPIIHGISLDIYPGEVFGFLGPNGAGKTTMIRMLVGLMKMSEGEIYIQGHHIQRDFEKAIAHVGGIIENPEMYSYLTGLENLKHYARLTPKDIPKKRLEEIIKLVGLEKRIHEKVKGYSLGMRQRLGIAQALLHSPSLLILDEPTNGLDPAGIREIRQYIRRIAHEENLAVFVSSHLLSEMQLMCDRIGIIQHGRLIRVEKIQDLVSKDIDLTVELKASPIGEAFQLLNDRSWYPKKKGSWIELTVSEEEEIPEVAELLISNQIKLYQIYSNVQTLEDTFLELTREES